MARAAGVILDLEDFSDISAVTPLMAQSLKRSADVAFPAWRAVYNSGMNPLLDADLMRGVQRNRRGRAAYRGMPAVDDSGFSLGG
jgi:phosphogluconate dehydratase